MQLCVVVALHLVYLKFQKLLQVNCQQIIFHIQKLTMCIYSYI